MNGTEYTEAEREILQHLKRYRVATRPQLDALPADEDALRALEAQGMVGWGRFDNGVPYLELALQAYPDFLGEPAPQNRLSQPAAHKAWAMATFCLEIAHCPRVAASDFAAAFPALYQRGLPAGDYYVREDAAGEGVLGLLLFDNGRLPIRIARRAHQLVARRAANAAFRQVLRAGRFEITVLTEDEAQQTALLEAFGRRPLPVELHIVVLPPQTLTRREEVP